jgi:hypothetical protein
MAIASTGSISMSTIQTEFGGSNPISISEYYRSNTYENNVSGNNTGIPQSGTIKLSQFRGTVLARYITYKLLGAGGGGGYGVENGSGSGTAGSGGNSTLTLAGTTVTATGGAGGGNGDTYYTSDNTAGQNADTSQGYSENFGTSGGSTPYNQNAAAGSGFAAGGSGGGGDRPSDYDSSGNRGSGGNAGQEKGGSTYVNVSTSISYSLGSGGTGGQSFHDGANGRGGYVKLISNGSQVVATGTSGSYTVV